tara:strand:- start:3709 stop:4917 length:1209 start_codon:yes stop_codon:yes gene_type:complete
MAYSNKVTQMFGDDLYPLFGPKKDRVKWSTLSKKEQRRRINNCPLYIDARKINPNASSFEDMFILLINECLNLGDKNPFYGLDLGVFDTLDEMSESYGVPKLHQQTTPIEKFWHNNKTQRQVFFRHLFEDLMTVFQPNKLTSGYGRMDSKGRLWINDGKHRTLGSMFYGIEAVSINYIISDDELEDVEQFATENISPLPASEVQKFNIRVMRSRGRVDADKPVLDEDEIDFWLAEQFDMVGITVVEKEDKEGPTSNRLSGIGNLKKYVEDYGQFLMQHAIEFDARTFPTTVVKTANIWGMAEFLKAQDQDVLKENIHAVMQEIKMAIKQYLPKEIQGNKLHQSIKDALKEQNEDVTSMRYEPMVIAKGIYKIVSKYSTDNTWEWNDIKLPKDFNYDFEMDLI